jgi:hypothetical protein
MSEASPRQPIPSQVRVADWFIAWVLGLAPEHVPGRRFAVLIQDGAKDQIDPCAWIPDQHPQAFCLGIVGRIKVRGERARDVRAEYGTGPNFEPGSGPEIPVDDDGLPSPYRGLNRLRRGWSTGGQRDAENA